MYKWKICMRIYIEFLFIESINFAITGTYASPALNITEIHIKTAIWQIAVATLSIPKIDAASCQDAELLIGSLQLLHRYPSPAHYRSQKVVWSSDCSRAQVASSGSRRGNRVVRFRFCLIFLDRRGIIVEEKDTQIFSE